MRQVACALIAITCLVLSGFETVQAQVPAPAGVSVGFRNLTNTSVIIQGYTTVNNVQRRGQNLVVNKNGGVAFENNVPGGHRYYTVFDANQPARILLRDYRVPVGNLDFSLSLVVSPTNPNQLALVPVAP